MHYQLRALRRLTAGLLAGGLLSIGNTYAVEREMGTDFSNVPQRLIVQYKDTTARNWRSQAGALSSRGGATINHVRAMGMKDRQVFRLQNRLSGPALDSLMRRLESDPNVLSVQEDALMQPTYEPNDTFYPNQWHYYETTGGINLPAAWDKQTGSGVVVAVLDTGYTNHSDLVGNLLPGYDFIDDTAVANDGDGRDADPSDPGDWLSAHECGLFNPPSPQGSSWHGTHVAGTVSAVTNNSKGVAGAAFGAMVVPVRVLGKCGGYLSDIADGIIWASGGSVAGAPANANPAQVINMSLGGGGACDATYQSAIDIAVANGATVVVSAGNSSDEAANYRPSSCNNVINVAANDRQGNLAYYSNYGSVDLTAPGGETNSVGSDGVASTLNDGTEGPGAENYVYYQGTSMSAPHVAATAALMYSANPSATPAEIETALKNTARPMPGECAGGCGAGIIDASAAIDAIGGSGGGNLPPNASFSHAANLLQVDFTDSSSDPDGSITSWSWNFGDGNTSTAQNPSHTYAAAGTYTVNLTVTDNEGATNSDAQSVSVSDGSPAPTSDGFTETGISLSKNQWTYYTIDVPAGASRLEVSTSGGSGDIDLYVKFGANPTNGDYDCRDTGGGNNEACTITSPTAGTWHIGLKARRSGASGVQLDAYWYNN